MTRTILFTAAGLVAAAGSAGCDAGPATEFHVSGTVTVGGQPVHSGRVYFTPDRRKGNDGPQGFAVIRDGRFDTRSDGRPAPPGAVVVRVDGYGPPPAGSADGVPLVWDYQTDRDLPRENSKLDVDVPESSRAKSGGQPQLKSP